MKVSPRTVAASALRRRRRLAGDGRRLLRRAPGARGARASGWPAARRSRSGSGSSSTRSRCGCSRRRSSGASLELARERLRKLIDAAPAPAGAASMSAHERRRRPARISVGLAVRNDPERVGRCIESVLAQDLTDLELVICDNASDDETAETLERYAREDRAGEGHAQPGQHRLAREHEPGPRASRGTLFRWISADDWLEPQALVGRRARAGAPTRRDRGHLGLHDPHPGRRAAVRAATAGEFPSSPDAGAALRAHALVLPRRRRQVRPDLRDLPPRAADAHRAASAPPSAPTGC